MALSRNQDPRTIVSSIRDTRAAKRQHAFGKARDTQVALSRMSGSFMFGRDENGKQVETRTPESFGMEICGWRVAASFKRENLRRLPANIKAVESAVRRGRVPRKAVKETLHIIPAVRQLRHIREGYVREMEKTERKLLAPLDQKNVALAVAPSVPVIKGAAASLGALDDALRPTQTAIKKIIVPGRAATTMGILEESLALPDGRRAFRAGAAGAAFTSVREWLGPGRDRDIAGLSAHSLAKECALRSRRDEWLLSQFVKFAEMPQAISAYVRHDAFRLAVLNEVRRMLRRRQPKANREHATAKALQYIENGAPRFKSNNPGSGQLISHYRVLYRYVRDGETDKALKKLDYLALFVNANKPAFILRELSKDPEPYLAPVLHSLGPAVRALDERNFKAAAYHFSRARDLLRKIVSPS